jgi:hypothetical protein
MKVVIHRVMVDQEEEVYIGQIRDRVLGQGIHHQ